MKWTDEKIRDALVMIAAAVGGRMPTKGEILIALGSTGLYYAISRTGGRHAWSERLGLMIVDTHKVPCEKCGRELVKPLNITSCMCAACRKKEKARMQRERYCAEAMHKPMDATTLMLLVADVERGRSLKRAAAGLPWTLDEIKAFVDEQKANGNWDRMKARLRLYHERKPGRAIC